MNKIVIIELCLSKLHTYYRILKARVFNKRYKAQKILELVLISRRERTSRYNEYVPAKVSAKVAEI